MESPIFIVGCERSGNTLLRLILNQSPVLYIPSESGFLDKLCLLYTSDAADDW